MTADQWHHVAASYDGQVIRVYIDGKNTDSVEYAGAVVYGERSLHIGHNGWSGGQEVIGNLSNLRIYRRALAPDEVKQLYTLTPSPRPQITLLTSLKMVTLSFSHLTIGSTYNLQLSGDFSTWTNHESSFSATNTIMVYPKAFNVGEYPTLFFRLASAVNGQP